MTFNIPANFERNKEDHLCVTLEKAGIYRGKQRYTVNEIPELGATVSPEVEAARWLLLRGADPMDQMAVSYPKGQGVPVELEFQGKPEIVLINPNAMGIPMMSPRHTEMMSPAVTNDLAHHSDLKPLTVPE